MMQYPVLRSEQYEGPWLFNRPPDRVIYGDWEFDPNEDSIVEKLVATRTTRFKVLEYEKVQERNHKYWRWVTEFWDTPAENGFKIVSGGVAREIKSDEDWKVDQDAIVIREYKPAKTDARKWRQYR